MYSLFIHGLSLHKTENRPQGSYSLPEEDRLAFVAKIASTSDETEIIKSGCKFVCKKLSFHKRNDLKTGEANCVGYAQYTAALHPLAMKIMPNKLKSFFKDHDFVEITTENGDTIFIDTSLQDLLGKDFI